MSERPVTPKLDRLLERLSGRLTRTVWLHGLGTALGATALWLAFAFLADWGLHLPAGVRIVHLAVLGLVPTWLLWRELVRPLARRPDRTGSAVLIERRHPELGELLVSAVQLADDEPERRRSNELVALVLADAERRAAAIDLAHVLDPRGPRRRMAGGVALGALCATLLVANPEAASIFLRRIAGGSTAWPQRTHLSLEIPLATETAAVAAEGDVIEVRVARGSDVPVLVRAEGVVPDEVVLHFSSGHQAVVASAGGPLFRTLLRSCQESIEFHATGGDDQDQRPTVRLIVLQPPDVAAVAVRVRPPAYSGLAERIVFDSDVEVLAGSQLSVHMQPDPPDARGVARVLPDDVVHELVAAPFPGRPVADGEPADEPRAGLAFELEPQHSLRYRFELVDDTGLPNPDPGLFAVDLVEDRAPEVEILSPGRGEQDTVAGGAIALRVRAEDDFGLARIAWQATASDGSATAEQELVFEAVVPVDLAAEAAAERPRGARRSAAAGVGRRLLSVSELAGLAATSPPALEPELELEPGEDAAAPASGEDAAQPAAGEVAGGTAAHPIVEGQQFELSVSATDNREPEPRVGRSAPVRVRVVSVDEFLRRIQDRLARIQTTVGELAELQLEKRRRTLDLVASLESDEPSLSAEALEVAALLTGQRRVLGDARAIERELAAIAEAVIYARVDERAAALLAFIDPLLSQGSERGFRAEPWRELCDAHAAGQLGASGLAGKLVEIVAASLDIGETLSGEAADAIERASSAGDATLVHDELTLASDRQAAVLARIETLLELLAEWDNFQSVLSLTRDILSRQKNLSEQTRQYAKDN